MNSLNEKIGKELQYYCEKGKPFGNLIGLFLNRSEYNTFINLKEVKPYLYYKSKLDRHECYEYNGNYWIPKIVETGDEPSFEIYVSKRIILDPLYYAHIKSEDEMIQKVKNDICEHFEPGSTLYYTIPQEFINEYKKLRQ